VKVKKDITIIGAGAVGIASALSLLEAGQTVELIDRDAPASGASHGNAGVVSPWTCVPQSMPGVWKSVPKWLMDPQGPLTVRWSYLPQFLPWAIRFIRAGQADRLPAIGDAMMALNRPNVDLYRHHLKGTGKEDLLRDSYYVHVYRNPESVDLNQLGWRMRAERGVPLEVVQEGELREIEPAIAPDYRAAVLIKDQARAMDPGAIGKALADKAEAMGAVFHRATVKSLVPVETGGWKITTDTGDMVAKSIVVAAGAWSLQLLKPLGVNVPLEAERGYHVVLRDPGITINNSIMDTERKFVASSMAAGVRCAGTAEFAGLDAPPDYRRAKALTANAKRLFPDINTQDTIEWMGSRPSFPDSLPCIGQVPGHENLFAAFGHSHYGFGMAPATGRIVANIVRGVEPNTDLAPYRIERFG
jgi:D-amino-acid dehydrogenase